MPDKLVEILTLRENCTGDLFAWQCWCPACTASIVQEYRVDPLNRHYSLPTLVFKRVMEKDIQEKKR